MAEEVLEWQNLWGAKVKSPVDIPDDILKDVIEITSNELENCDNYDTGRM